MPAGNFLLRILLTETRGKPTLIAGGKGGSQDERFTGSGSVFASVRVLWEAGAHAIEPVPLLP